ncbi:hypothetical protein, variant [Cryptococcus amylolentus CBS 6039]|uniref:Uncharacterized protein n=1 Tax=Cryptococcus amylolentus CBS 6039 TaxID=1295533 RepID=A0A1E3I3L3_9TREE|nr:hypothetical protein, variant [Cryptococcus amylolentus CBS 6039]ODN83149.1 hypothetical protein, variant [Cryptococcus amylolentus CBS 6039]
MMGLGTHHHDHKEGPVTNGSKCPIFVNEEERDHSKPCEKGEDDGCKVHHASSQRPVHLLSVFIGHFIGQAIVGRAPAKRAECSVSCRRGISEPADARDEWGRKGAKDTEQGMSFSSQQYIRLT